MKKYFPLILICFSLNAFAAQNLPNQENRTNILLQKIDSLQKEHTQQIVALKKKQCKEINALKAEYFRETSPIQPVKIDCSEQKPSC